MPSYGFEARPGPSGTTEGGINRFSAGAGLTSNQMRCSMRRLLSYEGMVMLRLRSDWMLRRSTLPVLAAPRARRFRALGGLAALVCGFVRPEDVSRSGNKGIDHVRLFDIYV